MLFCTVIHLCALTDEPRRRDYEVHTGTECVVLINSFIRGRFLPPYSYYTRARVYTAVLSVFEYTAAVFRSLNRGRGRGDRKRSSILETFYTARPASTCGSLAWCCDRDLHCLCLQATISTAALCLARAGNKQARGILNLNQNSQETSNMSNLVYLVTAREVPELQSGPHQERRAPLEAAKASPLATQRRGNHR